LFDIFSLDQEQKEELIHVIEKLLSDKTTLVVGSAVMAFEEVCCDHHIYVIFAYKHVIK
jgi:vesicle coat complex subunit